MEKNRRNGWHLDKSVTIGQIFVIASIVISAGTYVGYNESNLNWLQRQVKQEEEARKEADEQIRKRIERMTQRNIRQFGQIQETLDRIEGRLRDKEDRNE